MNNFLFVASFFNQVLFTWKAFTWIHSFCYKFPSINLNLNQIRKALVIFSNWYLIRHLDIFLSCRLKFYSRLTQLLSSFTSESMDCNCNDHLSLKKSTFWLFQIKIIWNCIVFHSISSNSGFCQKVDILTFWNLFQKNFIKFWVNKIVLRQKVKF